ncbi:MAG: galactokinase [Erysipelotrichales bacterium]|nr:galactokinase [Erysipelotrichales bacterium]
MNLEERFYQEFGIKSEYKYRAPARINLIGEHIDYNGGKVLPCAISKYITALVSKRNDNIISISSTEIDKHFELNLSCIEYQKEYDWGNYVFGMFYTLLNEGYNISCGLNILVSSDIPLASGLSSSAALLDLICFLTNDIFNLKIENRDIAILAQKCENDFCGLKSGIMDEAAIALGKENKCMLLDCAKFEYKYYNLELNDYSFVVLKTNKPRKLVESKYNERVEECTKALNILKPIYDIENLCDLSTTELVNIKDYLNDDLLYRRVKHVITENNRVNEFIKALQDRKIDHLANILNDSHLSLKNDYEVSGMHLDAIVESAIHAGALGSRMTGAGFGGCAIALIKKSDFNGFKAKVEKEYFEKTNIIPDIFVVKIANGPKVLNNSKKP